jgi:hypothetical protein
MIGKFGARGKFGKKKFGARHSEEGGRFGARHLPAVAGHFGNPATNAFTPYGYRPGEIFWRAGENGQMRDKSWFINNVLHEVLHTLGYSDDNLQDYLIGFGNRSPVTDNITVELAKHCFK